MDVSSTTLNQGLVWLVGQGAGPARLYPGLASGLDWRAARPATGSGNAARPAAMQPDVNVAARGTQTFEVSDESVGVGDSGVRVKVSDLSLDTDEQTQVIGGRRYHAPAFTRAGHAHITGTSGADDLTISQDGQGNTVLAVRWNGKTEALNLGRIAAVTVSGGEGDDTITVRAANYYGGIQVSGGAGDDEIKLEADQALARGVRASGDAGDDVLTLSGPVSRFLAEGGDGDDRLDIRDAVPADGLTHELFGGVGRDMLWGSRGADLLYGGAEADLILAGAGDDRVEGGDGADTIHGGAGADMLFGGAGNDRILGDEGDDYLNGEGGDDVLMGGPGRSTLMGGPGQDALYGGGGVRNWALVGDSGLWATSQLISTLYGGAGADLLAPVSESPSILAAYVGTGRDLPDYEPGVDTLV